MSDEIKPLTEEEIQGWEAATKNVGDHITDAVVIRRLVATVRKLQAEVASAELLLEQNRQALKHHENVPWRRRALRAEAVAQTLSIKLARIHGAAPSEDSVRELVKQYVDDLIEAEKARQQAVTPAGQKPASST